MFEETKESTERNLLSQQVHLSEAEKATSSFLIASLIYQHLGRDLNLVLWLIKV